MQITPKRDGLVLDSPALNDRFEDDDWPLRDSTRRLALLSTCSSESEHNLPRLTLSSNSSKESFDTSMPATPVTSPSTPIEEFTETSVLPGFHFSTTDASVDPADFHRMAAQLLSGEATKRPASIAASVEKPPQERHLHCDLGRDPSGRHCCSCGKSYSTTFRLRDHIQQCAGTDKYPCATCDKVFLTKEKLSRHSTQKHNGSKEPCPECDITIRADLLPKHLAGGCDSMTHGSMGPAPEIDTTYRDSACASTSQQFWIYNGNHSWNQSTKVLRDLKLDDPENEAVEQTMSFVKRLLKRPVSRHSKEPCDLCGETFSTESDEFAQHIGQHSLDFAEKQHKCDECRIFFANEKDLDRHLQSASLNQHCGFTFRHVAGVCSGHHPPPYYTSSMANNHSLMQKHLWAWELCQLRTHRTIVARMLAERLSRTASPHMSLQDCRRAYVSLLPHFSVASHDSTSADADYIRDQSSTESAQLDDHFSLIMSEVYPEEDLEMLRKIDRAYAVLQMRPDSTVLAGDRDSKRSSRRRSIMDSTKWKPSAVQSMKNGHQRDRSNPISFFVHSAKVMDRPRSLPPHTAQSNASTAILCAYTGLKVNV